MELKGSYHFASKFETAADDDEDLLDKSTAIQRFLQSGAEFGICALSDHDEYMHWVVQDGKFIAIDYTSEKGSERVQDMTVAWKTQTLIEELVDIATSISYKEIKENRAVLIAGARNNNDFLNYRHQADVLNMYQLLKKSGYDDDHIILIMEDDVAYNRRNTTDRGAVLVKPDGENLYHATRSAW